MNEFTIENVMQAIAAYIKTGYPEVNVYAGANQQGTEIPCFFIMLVNPNMTPETGVFYLRDIALDIVYLQERNALNSNLALINVLEWLDTNMDQIPFGDGVIWTYGRESSIEDEDLHYKLHIKGRVYLSDPQPLMETLEGLNATATEIDG